MSGLLKVIERKLERAEEAKAAALSEMSKYNKLQDAAVRELWEETYLLSFKESTLKKVEKKEAKFNEISEKYKEVQRGYHTLVEEIKKLKALREELIARIEEEKKKSAEVAAAAARKESVKEEFAKALAASPAPPRPVSKAKKVFSPRMVAEPLSGIYLESPTLLMTGIYSSP